MYCIALCTATKMLHYCEKCGGLNEDISASQILLIKNVGQKPSADLDSLRGREGTT